MIRLPRLFGGRRRSRRHFAVSRSGEARNWKPSVEPLETLALLAPVAPGLNPVAEVAAVRPAASFPGRFGFGLARGSTLRNLPYLSDNGSLHRLDVYLPAGTPPGGGWPVVLAIHGGGWRRFSKEQYGPRAAVLTRSGFAVVAPDYTLASRGRPSWPTVLEDLRGSVRWVEAVGPSLGLDPDRVASMGESAGGHLALLLGTTPDPGPSRGLPSAKVDAVVSFYGPTDLPRLSSTSFLAAPAVNLLLGAPPAFNPVSAIAASPTTWVSSDDPPALLLQGTADPLVPADQAIVLDARYAQVGVPHRLILVPASHGFGFRVAGRDLLPEVTGFLALALRPTSTSTSTMTSTA